MGKLNLQLQYPNTKTEKTQQRFWLTKCYTLADAEQNTGFSLLELMVVLVMIGILSAIASPSWLAFVNRQKVNKANDVVLAALQQAQQQAKKTKFKYSVSFRTNNNISQVAVYQKDTVPNWQNLGGDLGIDSGQILLGANLSAENTANTSVSYSLTTPVTITYDYMGTLPSANFGTIPTGQTEAPGLKIIVAVPQLGSTTQASSLKRCVIVKTLLGSMLTAKDTDCN